MRYATLLLLVGLCAGPASGQDTDTAYVERKDPTTATLFGVLIPGGGQIYAGDTQEGIGGLVVTVSAAGTGYAASRQMDGSAQLTDLPLLAGLGVGLGMWVGAAVQAGDAARRANQEHRLTVQPTTGGVKLALSF